MSSLTTQQKIGQLFFIGIPGPELDETTLSLLDRIQPGGVCLFSRNIRERLQTRELLDGLRHVPASTPFLSVDQEGGLVDRLRRIMTPMPPANKIRSTEDAAQFGSLVGETLRILGFNMNFAPVVDIIDTERAQFTNGLHSRAFGRSKIEAADFAAHFLEEMQAAGIIGCLKHFPGLGASEVDSHKELPKVSIDEKEFEEKDLYPYATILSSVSERSETGGPGQCVMIAHAAFPNSRLQEADQSGKLLPSSLSPAIISKLLRGELGYDGLVLTDDLEMGAIVENYGMGEACVMAIEAGVDMLAICASTAAIDEGHTAISEAFESGRISEDRIDESVARISTLKRKIVEPLPFDDEKLEALSSKIGELNDRLE